MCILNIRLLKPKCTTVCKSHMHETHKNSNMSQIGSYSQKQLKQQYTGKPQQQPHSTKYHHRLTMVGQGAGRCGFVPNQRGYTEHAGITKTVKTHKHTQTHTKICVQNVCRKTAKSLKITVLEGPDQGPQRGHETGELGTIQ